MDRQQVALLAQGALGLWLFCFVFSLLSATIANGIFGVPLYQIVDSDFSVVLFFLALGCVFVALALALNLISRNFVGALVCLFLLALYAGQSFAAVGAYLLYAWFDGVHLAGMSFVYDGYSRVVADASKIIGAGLVASVAVGKTVNWWSTMQGMATVGGCVTFLSSIVATLIGRRVAEA